MVVYIYNMPLFFFSHCWLEGGFNYITVSKHEKIRFVFVFFVRLVVIKPLKIENKNNMFINEFGVLRRICLQVSFIHSFIHS